jgi:hypothetical protein
MWCNIWDTFRQEQTLFIGLLYTRRSFELGCYRTEVSGSLLAESDDVYSYLNNHVLINDYYIIFTIDPDYFTVIREL